MRGRSPGRLFWEHLQLRYVHFTDVGLAPDALDSLVWDTCQKEDLILVTNNRNRKEADSLESTIRAKNTPTSLPVFTIANVPHLRASRAYADRVIDKLLDSLLQSHCAHGSVVSAVSEPLYRACTRKSSACNRKRRRVGGAGTGKS